MKEGNLKRRIYSLIHWSGAAQVAAAIAPGVPVLAYHGVTAQPEGGGSNLRRLHVPRALFARQLEWLRTHRVPLPLEELRTRIAGRRSLPRRAVVLTFDDGYRNFATQAWPLLVQYGIPATLFVPTDGGGERFWQDALETAALHAGVEQLDWAQPGLSLRTPAQRVTAALQLVTALERMPSGQEHVAASLCERLQPSPAPPDEDRDRLSWDELKALRASGLDIGSHADRHQALTRRPEQEVAEALVSSHQALQRELGPGAYALSYPFGARSASVRKAAQAAGFTCAVTGVPKLARRGSSLFDLPRLLVGADDDEARLRVITSGLRGLWQRDPWPDA